MDGGSCSEFGVVVLCVDDVDCASVQVLKGLNMRDAHLLRGRTRYAVDLDTINTIVTETYPQAFREGSIGSWLWFVEEEIVAEANVRNRKEGWSFRIEPVKSEE